MFPVVIAMIAGALAQAPDKWIEDEANYWLVGPLVEAIDLALAFLPEPVEQSEMANNILVGRPH